MAETGHPVQLLAFQLFRGSCGFPFKPLKVKLLAGDLRSAQKSKLLLSVLKPTGTLLQFVNVSAQDGGRIDVSWHDLQGLRPKKQVHRVQAEKTLARDSKRKRFGEEQLTSGCLRRN